VLSLVLALISRLLSGLLIIATVGLASALISVSRFFASLPFASVATASCPWVMVAGWYFLIVVLVLIAPRDA
jgi:hypothetical protein